MSSFISACEELLEHRRNRRMVTGISFYKAVTGGQYLAPLRLSKSLHGPLKIDLSETNIFSVGRDNNCGLVLQEDMFREEENRKHDKE